MKQSKRPIVPFLAASAVTVAFALTASLAGTAGAQTTAAPAPDCSGYLFKDTAGDQGIPQGLVPLIPAGPNLDITGVFFRYDNDPDAKSPLTVNIQVTNLDKSIPLGGSTASWYAEWTVADVVYYAKASIDTSGAETYTAGIDDPSTGLDESLSTSGKFFLGANGVVKIFVPQAGTKAADGNVLKQAVAHTSVDLPGLLVFADNAPDSGTAKNYTVAQCPGTGTDTTTPPPTTGTTPPASTSTTLPIKLITSSAKASKKKTKAGKSLSLKLQASEQVTQIKGTLKKGSTTYGTGKLATLKGKGTLKIKLKKSLKKGTFKLKLSGTTAGGARSASYTIKVR